MNEKLLHDAVCKSVLSAYHEVYKWEQMRFTNDSVSRAMFRHLRWSVCKNSLPLTIFAKRSILMFDGFPNTPLASFISSVLPSYRAHLFPLQRIRNMMMTGRY